MNAIVCINATVMNRHEKIWNPNCPLCFYQSAILTTACSNSPVPFHHTHRRTHTPELVSQAVRCWFLPPSCFSIKVHLHLASSIPCLHPSLMAENHCNVSATLPYFVSFSRVILSSMKLVGMVWCSTENLASSRHDAVLESLRLQQSSTIFEGIFHFPPQSGSVYGFL